MKWYFLIKIYYTSTNSAFSRILILL